MVATGRTSNMDILHPEKGGIKIDEKGWIIVDEFMEMGLTTKCLVLLFLRRFSMVFTSFPIVSGFLWGVQNLGLAGCAYAPIPYIFFRYQPLFKDHNLSTGCADELSKSRIVHEPSLALRTSPTHLQWILTPHCNQVMIVILLG